MSNIFLSESAWIPAIASVLAVIIAGGIQYKLTQAAIENRSQTESLTTLVAEFFEGAANPHGQGQPLVAASRAKATVYGSVELVEAFARLERAIEADNSSGTQNALVDVVMAARRQAGLPEASKDDIAKLVTLK